MNLDDINQILALMREHDLSEFELERDGLKVRIRKGGQPQPLVVAAPPTPSAPVAAAAPLSALPAAASPFPDNPVVAGAVEDVNLAVVKSPIVGTFYRSPEPGAKAFVEVGDTVRKGQVLCIIEAMKLMNEIESDCDGELAATYVETGKAVQFGERLFAVRVAER